jgi:hypothetical protein
LFRDLKLHRTPSLLLHDNRPVGDLIAVGNVLHPQPYQVTGAELAVHCEIELREFACALGELESYPDSPDLALLEGRLLADEFALVPGGTLH